MDLSEAIKLMLVNVYREVYNYSSNSSLTRDTYSLPYSPRKIYSSVSLDVSFYEAA